MRFVAAVVAVPVLPLRLAGVEDPLARAAPAAGRVGRRRAPGRGRLPELPRLADRRAGARGRGPVRRAPATREPKLFLTRSTCGRLRDFAGHAHHSELDCLAGVDWQAPSPLPVRLPVLRVGRRHGLRRAHAGARGVPHLRRPGRGADQLLRDPGDGVDGGAARRGEPARRSCSRARWRRSSPPRTSPTGRTTATPAAGSTCIPRRRTSPRSTRRRRPRGATARGV